MFGLKNVKSGRAEPGVANGLHEGSEEALSLLGAEGVEEEIVADVDAGKIFNPPLPAPNLLLMSSFSDCVGSG